MRSIPKYFFGVLLKLYNFKPIPLPKIGNTCIVTISCHSHISMLRFSLYSLFNNLSAKYPCIVFDDGTLTKTDIFQLIQQFPGIQIIDRQKSDLKIISQLTHYPNCKKYRQSKTTPIFKLKLLDCFLLVNYQKIFYVDDDIIFLRKPSQILNWINEKDQTCLYAAHIKYKNFKQPDVNEESIAMIRMFIDKINKNIDFYFNSGLMCVYKQMYSLKRIDEILQYCYTVGLESSWSSEQLTLADAIANNKHICLPTTYIHLHSPVEYQTMKNPFSYTCIHFTDRTKPFYYHLANQIILKLYVIKLLRYLGIKS
jgi:hypothetical protein